jgi:hypothetical protein
MVVEVETVAGAERQALERQRAEQMVVEVEVEVEVEAAATAEVRRRRRTAVEEVNAEQEEKEEMEAQRLERELAAAAAAAGLDLAQLDGLGAWSPQSGTVPSTAEGGTVILHCHLFAFIGDFHTNQNGLRF